MVDYKLIAPVQALVDLIIKSLPSQHTLHWLRSSFSLFNNYFSITIAIWRRPFSPVLFIWASKRGHYSLTKLDLNFDLRTLNHITPDMNISLTFIEWVFGECHVLQSHIQGTLCSWRWEPLVSHRRLCWVGKIQAICWLDLEQQCCHVITCLA